jgi:glycosyltransferase involved in cell wall biosynthesis
MREYDISVANIHTYPLIAAIIFALKKINVKMPTKLFSQVFDYIVSKRVRTNLSKNTIFHGMSGFSLQSIKAAKKNGMKTFLDRACPHIDYQMTLINTELHTLLPAVNKKFSPLINPLHQKMLEEYEESDYIVVPSTYSYNSFLKKGFPAEKLCVARLSKEKNVKCQCNKKRKNQEFTMLTIGYNFIRKGFYYLLKAWREMNLPDAKLIIRHCIPPAFRKMAEHPSIQIISKHLSNDDLINLYHQADVFCLPSIDEGFGLVGLEAMAAGLPVIVTENVGMKDLIQSGREGFIIPIRDSQAIQSATIKLYKNKELRHYMSEKAIETERQYSLKRYVDEIMNIYARHLT